MTPLLILLLMLAQANVPRGNVERGKALYTKIGCYQCHGREGQGATATGPRLNQNLITFDRFVTYIRKPTGEMPPYTAKVVSDQDAADIFAFMQSLPKPPAADSIPLLQ
jgi:ubiquinol-cytochrome c reductase cytochrome c subunit